MRNVFKDISGVYNLNANKPALFNYDEETINLDTGNQKSLSLSGVNPETNEEVIIQFRIVERDLATLIGLNDYETVRLIDVLGRSRTLLLYQGQLKPLTASELCQPHYP